MLEHYNNKKENMWDMVASFSKAWHMMTVMMSFWHLLVFCLSVGFLNVLVNNYAVSQKGPKKERLTNLRATTHETELGDHDFCLSRSHYTDTDPTSREGPTPPIYWLHRAIRFNSSRLLVQGMFHQGQGYLLFFIFHQIYLATPEYERFFFQNDNFHQKMTWHNIL